MKTRMKKILGGSLVGATALLIAACLNPVGDGRGLNEAGEDTTGNGVAVVDTNLTFVYNKVFKIRCAGCHGSEPAGDGMNLSGSVATAREALFPGGNPRLSFQLPTQQPRWRVLPNQVDSSYLYQKITSSTPKSGQKMPQGGALNAAEIQIVRAWIQNGASLE